MTRVALLAGILPLGLAAACGPAPERGGNVRTPVQAHTAESAGDLFPLEEGNSWTYEMETLRRDRQGLAEGGSSVTTLKVVSVREVAGAKVAEVKVIGEDGREGATLIYRVAPEGMFQTGVRREGLSATFDPMLPVFLWPPEEGKKRNYSGKSYMPGTGTTGPVRAVLEMKGESEVDTLAGRMRAFRVDTVQNYRHEQTEFQATSRNWFAPKVGLVRGIEIIQTANALQESTVTLKSHTVK